MNHDDLGILKATYFFFCRINTSFRRIHFMHIEIQDQVDADCYIYITYTCVCMYVRVCLMLFVIYSRK